MPMEEKKKDEILIALQLDELLNYIFLASTDASSL